MPRTYKWVLYGLFGGGRPSLARGINAALLNVVVSKSSRYGLFPGPLHSFVLPFFLYRSLYRRFKMSISLLDTSGGVGAPDQDCLKAATATAIKPEGHEGDKA